MNKRRITINILPLLAIAIASLSCKKFLEEPPSKSTGIVVKTTAQLGALLDAQTNFFSESNRTAIFSTDDYDLSVNLYNANRRTFNYLSGIQFMLWDTQYLADDTREIFWSNEFKKIFTANLVLNELGKVSGTEADKAFLKADAHFIRAYSYWILVNTYCLPYTEQNKNERGLPIKKTTSFDESLQRQSIEKVYQLIESDLDEALKVQVSPGQSGVFQNWRINKAAVNAFAARYYLNRNDNTKALQYANASLADYNTMVDYNTDMRYGLDKVVSINPGPNKQDITIKFPYTANNFVGSNQADVNGWKELLYVRLLSIETAWFIPSQSLLDLYDKNYDLRYKYNVVKNYSYTQGMINPAYDYPGYIFFYNNNVPSGPTVAEVLLTKAEAQARLNDPTGAMITLNLLRVKRMLKDSPGVNLVTSGKDDAIKKISEERRREMPFSQRWFDIRRYNSNDDPNDDVVLTKTFYPYSGASILVNETPKVFTLPKNSRRYAAPIPRTEITTSNGAIEQNTY